MPSIKALVFGTLALFSTIHSSFASPTPSPNITVMVRNESYAYHPSEEMRNTVLARHAENPIEKRSFAKVQACLTASCTDCRTLWDAQFTTGTSCISAANTACLIISDLDDANVWYWSGTACNGRNSHYSGCPKGKNSVGAPNTQSIGVHPGCS